MVATGSNDTATHNLHMKEVPDMATYININETRYTISQVKAMRKAELVSHVMGLADEINRLNTAIRNERDIRNRQVKPTKATKSTKATKATKAPKPSTWKNVEPANIHASFKLAGVTQTMQRRATFALNRGDSPTAVADYAVGTRRNKRWTKIHDGAVKARA